MSLYNENNQSTPQYIKCLIYNLFISISFLNQSIQLVYKEDNCDILMNVLKCFLWIKSNPLRKHNNRSTSVESKCKIITRKSEYWSLVSRVL